MAKLGLEVNSLQFLFVCLLCITEEKVAGKLGVSSQLVEIIFYFLNVIGSDSRIILFYN